MTTEELKELEEAAKKAAETSAETKTTTDGSGSEVNENKESQEVNEEVSLYKDAENNLVDSNGKVVYKAGQYEVDGDGNVNVKQDKIEEQNFFALFKEVTGEEYKEGLNVKEALHDVANTIAESVLQETINKLPTVARNIVNLSSDSRALSEYLRNLDSQKVVDYETFSIPATDRKGREEFVREQIRKTNPDFVEVIMNNIKDKNEIDSYFDKLLTSLKDTQAAEKKQLKLEEEANKKEQEELSAKIINDVKLVIEKPFMNGKVVLDKKEQETLMKATFEKNKNGNTIIDEKLSNLTYEQSMFINYLIMNDFNLDKIVKKAILDSKKANNPASVKLAGDYKASPKNLEEEFFSKFKN